MATRLINTGSRDAAMRLALILQGERDSFGNRDEVKGYRLPRRIKLHWLTDGDHSLKPRKSSGRTEEDNWQEAVEVIADFVHGLASA